MSILVKGNTFNDGDQITSTKLNNLVDNATFAATAVDDVTIGLATGKLTLKTVQTGNLANSVVTTAKIADSNVTTAKIADASVTTAKLAPDAIASASNLDGSVTAPKLSGAQTGVAPIFGCRAYGAFDGTATSPITPIKSGNIQSITRTTTGTWQVVMAIGMENSSYCVVANATHSITSTFATNCYVSIINNTTFQISTGRQTTTSAQFYNSTNINFAVFQ